MVAFEKSLQWQELFDLALREGMSEEEVVSTGYRVSGVCICAGSEDTTKCKLEDLSSKKRYSEAARVLLDYCKDSRQAVIALVQGNSFSEARRIVSRFGRICQITLSCLAGHFLPCT